MGFRNLYHITGVAGLVYDDISPLPRLPNLILASGVIQEFDPLKWF